MIKRNSMIILNLIMVNHLFAENRTILTLPNATVKQDSTIGIPLAIQTDQEIGLAQFVLEFDSTIFSYQGSALDSELNQFQLTENNNPLSLQRIPGPIKIFCSSCMTMEAIFSQDLATSFFLGFRSFLNQTKAAPLFFNRSRTQFSNNNQTGGHSR